MVVTQRVRVPDTEVASARAVGYRLSRALIPQAHDSPTPAKQQFLDLSQWPDCLAFFTSGTAGGSKPSSWALSCPDTTSVAGMGKEEDYPEGTINSTPCPNWVPTWARTIVGPRGPAPSGNHALHPLGFSRVVKAQEGGLTQAQHAACRERKCLGGQAEAGLRQPSPPSTGRLTPASREPAPPALSVHMAHA